MKKPILLSLVALFLFAIITGTIMKYSAENTEIDLRNQTTAQQTVCQAYFDKMWKILQTQAQVADQYKNAFKEIYPQLIAGRYSKEGGSLMQWITEHNPEFKTDMYQKLMQSIEIERSGYFNQQSRLIDLQREHASYIKKAPNRWFLNDTLKPVAIVIVTSGTTKSAYATGEENSVDLFKK